MKKIIFVPILLTLFASVSAATSSMAPSTMNTGTVQQYQSRIPQGQTQTYNTGYNGQGYTQTTDYQMPNSNQTYSQTPSYSQQAPSYSQQAPTYRQNPNDSSNYMQNSQGNQRLNSVNDFENQRPLNSNMNRNGSFSQIRYDNPQAVENNQNQTYNKSEKHPQDRFSTESDHQINTKIRDRITGWFTDDYKNITVTTENGRTLVKGFVSTNEEKNNLAEEVRRIQSTATFDIQIKQ